MTNSVASTNTVNIVPIQGTFTPSGTLVNLIGPGGVSITPPVSPVQASDLLGNVLAPNVLTSSLTSLGTINNLNANNASIGKLAASTLNASTDSIVNTLNIGLGGGQNPNNTALGSNVLQSNLTGGQNTGVGSAALAANTTGIQNIAVGSNTLRLNITGSQNTAVGMQALQLNTAGSNNTAMGMYALLTNTGSGNTAIGSNAGNAISVGTSNVCIGNSAGSVSGGIISAGQNNVCIGAASGIGPLSTTNTVAIGQGVLVNATNRWCVGGINSIQRISESNSGPAMGIATLGTGGTVVVANTAIAVANQRIFLTNNGVTGTPGVLSIGTRIAGVSFVINSSSPTDTSQIAWEIKEPL